MPRIPASASASRTARDFSVGPQYQSMASLRSRSAVEMGPSRRIRSRSSATWSPWSTEDLALVGAAGPVPGQAMPGQLARREDAEALVVGLEQEAPLVEQVVRPRAPVAGDAGVEDEVVVAPGDLERVELQGAEAIHDGEDALLGGRQRARRGEEVAEHQEAPRDGGGQRVRGGRGGHGVDRSRSPSHPAAAAAVRRAHPDAGNRAGPSGQSGFFADPISLWLSQHFAWSK